VAVVSEDATVDRERPTGIVSGAGNAAEATTVLHPARRISQASIGCAAQILLSGRKSLLATQPSTI